jgi:hypothetical protein
MIPLRCPFCTHPLRSTADSATLYDILVCPCSEYPVVEGIPILYDRRSPIEPEGVSIQNVVSLVRVGRHLEALLALVLPGDQLHYPSVATLPGVRGFMSLVRHRHRASRQQRLLQIHADGNSTVCDAFS